MKKRICTAFITLMMLSSFTFTALADENIKVAVNGNTLSFDVNPQIINGRTMVPLREIFENLGAEIIWDDETKTVIATKDSLNVYVTLDSDKMKVVDSSDGSEKYISLDSPATSINGRTLVPVRVIAEAFNCNVTWNNTTKIVSIKTNKTDNSNKTSTNSLIKMNEDQSVYKSIEGKWIQTSYSENYGNEINLVKNNETNTYKNTVPWHFMKVTEIDSHNFEINSYHDNYTAVANDDFTELIFKSNDYCNETDNSYIVYKRVPSYNLTQEQMREIANSVPFDAVRTVYHDYTMDGVKIPFKKHNEEVNWYYRNLMDRRIQYIVDRNIKHEYLDIKSEIREIEVKLKSKTNSKSQIEQLNKELAEKQAIVDEYEKNCGNIVFSTYGTFHIANEMDEFDAYASIMGSLGVDVYTRKG